MLLIFGTLLYYLNKDGGRFRIGIFAALPCFTWLSIGYIYADVIFFLHEFYKYPFSEFFATLVGWDNIIQLVCFLWLVFIFFWLLFKRYQKLDQQLIQSSLDKERLAKEREIERSQLIEKQNAELEEKVEARTAQLKQSVEDLKNTQRQLIQSEKMASLGELTAGIAHEIQNPLNFVNNFSEVSIELLEELEAGLMRNDKEEAIDLAGDVKQNLEKIQYHGKRADFIVKGMLQHSRTSTGEKQLTNINVLADEFLKLSYHGLRAKDKNFNAEMVTDFDETIAQVNIVQQDIGRVFLNLFNNAFYAVNKKRETAGESYKPVVEVSTSANDGFIVVTVKDNGVGIPDDIKDKILQPFFTTKPTGEGTGLGLSISYDIVVKGNGGKLDLKSKGGEFTEFRIQLPI
jgi:signal transduction histidine kinase